MIFSVTVSFFNDRPKQTQQKIWVLVSFVTIYFYHGTKEETAHGERCNDLVPRFPLCS